MIDQVPLHDWLQLIRAEYDEIPDLELTRADVEHWWGLDSGTADAVLTALISAGVIKKTPRGAYVRAKAGECLDGSL